MDDLCNILVWLIVLHLWGFYYKLHVKYNEKLFLQYYFAGLQDTQVYGWTIANFNPILSGDLCEIVNPCKRSIWNT